ncbi:DUF2274 domain-containing protein [Agrobacterium vitis]|nr:DUF2274 domain-containing protein [Agrobacterium vitis]
MHALTRESGNAELLNRQQAQSSADPAKLIVPMLERFIATDRGFVKKAYYARRYQPTTSNAQGRRIACRFAADNPSNGLRYMQQALQ